MKPISFQLIWVTSLVLLACDAKVDFGAREEGPGGVGGVGGAVGTDPTGGRSTSTSGGAIHFGGGPTSSGASVIPAACGDGKLATSESCDDGNTLAGDGCSGACLLEPGWTCIVSSQPCANPTVDGHATHCPTICSRVSQCGNGKLEAGEACDNGTMNGIDNQCTVNCVIVVHTSAQCGNGVIESGEACDDGNVASGDGCPRGCDSVEYGWTCSLAGHPCVATLCGNGVVELGETCDEGSLNGTKGHCARKCNASPICGDGIVMSPPEQCDRGNQNGGPDCTKDCLLADGTCGDGIISGREECDDGINDGGYGECGIGCFLGPTCGDGILDAEFEECDAGGRNGTGICSTSCLLM